jgi:hypothetical protein
MRDLSPSTSEPAIELPSRFDSLDPFQRVLLTGEIEDRLAETGPCLLCGKATRGSVSVSVYGPATAILLGAPDYQSVAVVLLVCRDCKRVHDDTDIDRAVIEQFQQRRKPA